MSKPVLARYPPNPGLISKNPIWAYSTTLKKDVDVSNWNMYDFHKYKCRVTEEISRLVDDKVLKNTAARNPMAFAGVRTGIRPAVVAAAQNQMPRNIPTKRRMRREELLRRLRDVDSTKMNKLSIPKTDTDHVIAVRPNQDRIMLVPGGPWRPISDWMIPRGSKAKFYAGRITRLDYPTDPVTVTNIDQFRQYLASTVWKEIEDYIARKDKINRSFVIRVFYDDLNSPDRKSYVLGTVSTLTDLETIPIHPTLEEWVAATPGSDTTGRGLDVYVLNLESFIIDVISPERSGGSSSGTVTNIRGTVRTFPWGKTKDYPSKHNGCFIKILSVVLEAPNYLTLLNRLVDIKMIGRDDLITFSKGREIAEYFDSNLRINYYDSSGSPLDIDSRPAMEDNVIVPIMYSDKHYQHITHFRTTPQPLKAEIPLVDAKKTLIVHFDFETVTVKKTDMVVPYLVAWEIECLADGEERSDRSDDDPVVASIAGKVLCDEHPVDHSLMTQFFTELLAMRAGKIILIAYNGAKFDNYIVLHYVSRLDNCLITNLSQNNKLNRTSFIINNTRFGVWDPCQFLATSLKKAAKDFGTTALKTECDHEQIQADYLSTGKVGITEEMKEYCLNDVGVLKELCHKVWDVCGRTTILKCANIAQYAWKLFTGDIDNDFKEQWIRTPKNRMDRVLFIDYCENLVDRVEVRNPCRSYLSYDKDLFARMAIYGGRCGGNSYRWPKGLTGKMIDLVSQYPAMMKFNDYPFGEADWVSSEKIMEVLYDYSTVEDEDGKETTHDTMGFAMIKVTQVLNKFGHCLLPIRREDGRLRHDVEGVTALVVPLFVLRHIIADKEHFKDLHVEMGLLFQNKGKPIFNDFITKYYSTKAEQDALGEGHPDYNPSLRNMAKLILNSTSGKTSERIYTHTKKMLTKRELIDKALSGEKTHGNTNYIGDDMKPDAYVTFLENYLCGARPKISGLGTDTSLHTVFTPINQRSLLVECTYTPQEIFESKRTPAPSYLGAHIYWYARMRMWTDIFSKTHCYYTDTDSAVVDTSFEIATAKQLGAWDIEKENIRAIITPQPKVYVLLGDRDVAVPENKDAPEYLDDLVIMKTRFKGVQSKDKKSVDGREVESVAEFIQALEENKVCTVSTMQFRGESRRSCLQGKTLVKRFGLERSDRPPRTTGN